MSGKISVFDFDRDDVLDRDSSTTPTINIIPTTQITVTPSAAAMDAISSAERSVKIKAASAMFPLGSFRFIGSQYQYAKTLVLNKFSPADRYSSALINLPQVGL